VGDMQKFLAFGDKKSLGKIHSIKQMLESGCRSNWLGGSGPERRYILMQTWSGQVEIQRAILQLKGRSNPPLSVKILQG